MKLATEAIRSGLLCIESKVAHQLGVGIPLARRELFGDSGEWSGDERAGVGKPGWPELRSGVVATVEQIIDPGKQLKPPMRLVTAKFTGPPPPMMTISSRREAAPVEPVVRRFPARILRVP
ncbi:MAG: hypothetical protein AB7U82_33285 [Blastocatellales bacterium]